MPELLRPRPLVFARQLICNCGFYVSSLLFGTGEGELEYCTDCTGLKVPPENGEGSRHRPNFEVCFYRRNIQNHDEDTSRSHGLPGIVTLPVTALDRSWRSSKWPRPFRRDSSTGNTETTRIARIKLTPPKHNQPKAGWGERRRMVLPGRLVLLTVSWPSGTTELPIIGKAGCMFMYICRYTHRHTSYICRCVNTLSGQYVLHNIDRLRDRERRKREGDSETLGFRSSSLKI